LGRQKLKLSRNDEVARYREGRAEILFAIIDRWDGIFAEKGGGS
jgi:hypothetical protein